MSSQNTEYCIKGYIRIRFIFAPFALAVSGRISDCSNLNVSNTISFNTTVCWGIQDWAKLFARVEGRELLVHWTKLTINTNVTRTGSVE